MTSNDAILRQFERQYLETPSCQNYRRWVHAARRVGKPLFTIEGVIAATQGKVTSFAHTQDGFIAELEGATKPWLPVKVKIGPDRSDYEYVRLPGSWHGTLVLDCSSDEDQDPTVVLEVFRPGGEWFGGTYLQFVSGLYFYIENKIHNDEELIKACDDDRYFPLTKHGWDNG